MMPAHETRPRPLWPHVAAFIGLTFALTWLVDLSMYLRGGLQMPGALAGIQLQMLLPAFLPDLKNAYASVLLIAYLHALNDQVVGYIVFLGFKPHDPVYSFGIGIYGLITLAIVAVLLLRAPIWRSALVASPP